jgi:hypothetical protein
MTAKIKKVGDTEFLDVSEDDMLDELVAELRKAREAGKQEQPAEKKSPTPGSASGDKQYEHRTYHRELTKYERRVNFEKADDSLTTLTRETDRKIRAIIAGIQKSTLKNKEY